MRFSEFVNKKDQGFNPEEGLAGFGYDGPYAYPKKPEQGKDPLPYQNPDEPDSKTGEVWVARDSDKQKSLADSSTKGMEKAVPELTKPDGKVRETNPPPKWSKLSNKAPKEMPETKIKKKITNEEFVKISKEKNISEMIGIISEQNNSELTPITDLFGNEFTPEPNQTIQYISGILSNSPRMMDRFIIEMKNRGGFNGLLECMMQHQNCFDGIVEMFGRPEQGKMHSKQLAQAMHDKYSSALDSVDFSESVDAAPDKRFGVTPQPQHNKHGLDKLDLDDHPQGNGSVGGQGPVGGTMEPTNFGGQGMPNPTSGMPDFGQGPLAAKKKLMKAETAAGNLFGASATFPHLRSEMEGACKNCMK